jgi:MFS family permease
MLPDETKKAMENIVATQCWGVPASMFFINGFMFAYLATIGMSSVAILQVLSIPNLLSLLVRIPAALLSDRVGKKQIGYTGSTLYAVGFLLLAISASIKGHEIPIAILGIVLYGIGDALFSSNWFALLDPIIPASVRGRFFAKLRISWQTVSIILLILTSLVLSKLTSVSVYQLIIIGIIVMLIIRILYYKRIPEIEKPNSQESNNTSFFIDIVEAPNYVPFCSYVFLISLFTGACPWIFNLMEKDVLHFSKDQIVLMGALLMIGAVAGYYLGGRMVDKIGTRYVFLICHFSFSLVLFLFLLRDWIPLPFVFTIGGLTTLFGLIVAASGIAITSELLAVIPPGHKSLSTAIITTLQTGAIAIAGLISAGILGTEMLAESWLFYGKTYTRYDTIILIFSIMIFLITITLSLVPSVVKKAQTIPRGGI